MIGVERPPAAAPAIHPFDPLRSFRPSCAACATEGEADIQTAAFRLFGLQERGYRRLTVQNEARSLDEPTSLEARVKTANAAG